MIIDDTISERTIPYELQLYDKKKCNSEGKINGFKSISILILYGCCL
ncbi:hypothetical protein [Oceanirhabdus seepicola]|uniref:Uncharacterized protein n=1 Tax=Oceanirhabdus seepicola TaxID=2828781 RepID=A0A9J6NXV6_9CLOT|nr:hypothetical protein [Oceanirhabdus seepicola]MCM1989282.1 hypothetical protein [Oceanirhabdus seepicola]